MATVHRWTGLEARALRLALRMSVRSFACHLGVGIRTISKWEKLLASTEPRQDTQAILDTALARADSAAHLRFDAFLTGRIVSVAHGLPSGGLLAWEYESWSDDLDRAAVCLSRQDFTFAENLVRRWLGRFELSGLDDKGVYLHARSTALLGDLQRDQGAVLGPLSAQHSYASARSLFDRLGIPRRVAQLDLSLAVIAEMSGRLESAAQQYQSLAGDARLSRRDRARAQLWVGTALSKSGSHGHASRFMLAATKEFEDLEEPEDWSVAHQKIALAHRGAGDLPRALRFIGLARSTAATDTPMQRVRLETAHGHILLSDPATRDDGLNILDKAARVACQFGLSHQLASIEGIRAKEKST
ncbi:helix-turn-helix domain-containing protein [Streptomyces erythrochromogenes]|uniref:helix-turn-helix domain-containing protein n=1 Tax=Streptomyces erythrochromogenes TaxID=285574 RepID=UPI00382FE393